MPVTYFLKDGCIIVNKIIEIKNLKKYFPIRTGLFQRVSNYVKAVDNVSLDVQEGDTLGLVGESGSGKTTLGETIIKLLEPNSGKIIFNGEDITDSTRDEFPSGDMQIVFQDPHTSLNPRMKVKSIVAEPLVINNICKGSELENRVSDLLEEVGLQKDHLKRYPHEFSGGQKQRIAIARSLSVKPSFIVLDEPTSALDVSVQAKILKMLKGLQDEHQLTYLFISHDLGVIKHISDTIAVMYCGKVLEVSPKQELFENPLSPYTEALLSAIPNIESTGREEEIILSEDVPDPSDPPEGCRFQPRCPKKIGEVCETKVPELTEIENERYVSCHLYS